MVVVAVGVLGDSLSTSGHIDNRHSHAPWILRHPVRMVSPAGSNTVTVSLKKRTLYYVSKKGTIPMS